MNVRTLSIARSLAVIGSTGALIAGVTFAAVTSNSVTLSDNTVSTASAGLQLWNGSNFVNEAPGFQISNLVPGHGTYNKIYFKNTGGVDLKLTAHVPSAPTATGFSGWQNLKVYIKNDAAGGAVTSTNMQALLGEEVALNGVLAAGARGDAGSNTAPGNYEIKYDIDPAAITGSQATVGNFNVVFSGTDSSSTTPTAE